MATLARRFQFELLIAVFLLCATKTRAQTPVQWNGGAGNWSNAADWSTGVVPNDSGTNLFNVTIGNAPTADSVTLDTSATVDGLTVGDLATLSATSAVNLTAATLVNNSTLDFTFGGALSASGTATNSGLINLSGRSTGSFAGLDNSGTVELGATGLAGSLNVSGTFGNRAGATLLLANDSTASINALTNLGTVTVDSGSSLILTGGVGITSIAAGATFNVGGTINVSSGTGSASAFGSLASIAGTLNLMNGQSTSVLPASGSITMTVAAGGVLNVGNGSTLSVTGGVTNAGLIETGAGSSGNNVIGTGTFTNGAGGSLVLNDAGDAVNAGTLRNSGAVTVDEGAALTVAGSSISANSGTIGLQGGTLSAINLSNSGTISALAPSTGSTVSSFTISGTLTNELGGTIDLSAPGSFGFAGQLSNSGTLNIARGALFSLTNQAQGITDIGAGSTIDVAGTFNDIVAGATFVGPLQNLASVEGNLTLENGQSWNLGASGTTLTVSNAGNMNIQQSTAVTTNGNINNSGVIATNEGNLSAGQTNTLTTLTSIFTNNAGGQLIVGDFDDTRDVANLGTLVNDGSVYIGTGATLNVANAITSIAAGSTLTVKGSFNQTSGVGGAVTGSGIAAVAPVNGTLVLENGQTNSIVSQVSPQSGQVTTLAVGAGGQLTLAGAGTTLNVTDMLFSNAGTVTIGKGTALNLIDDGVNAGLNFTAGQADLRILDADSIAAGSTLTIGGSFNIVFPEAGVSENVLGLLQTVSGTLDLQNGQTTTISAPANSFPQFTVNSGGQLIISGGTSLIVNETLANGGVIRTGTQGGNNTLIAPYFQNGGTLSVEGQGDQVTFANQFNNDGNIVVENGATLTAGGFVNGASIQVIPGGTLVAEGAIQNFGTIALGQIGAAGPQAAATLVANGAVFTLSGPASDPTFGGQLVLYNASDAITTSAPGGEFVNDLSIEGTGNIGEGLMQITNIGSITSNATSIEPSPDGTALTIQPNGGGLVNDGTIYAQSGNSLQIDLSDISFTGNRNAVGFTNNNVVAANGTVVLTDRDPNTSVTTLNSGAIQVAPGGSGTLELNGTNTSFNFIGSGSIQMFAGAQITGVTGTETLVNGPGHTIEGSGSISNLNVTNEGALTASQAGTPLVITPADGTLINTGGGVLSVVNGTTLSINGSVSNSATVSIQQGNTLALNGGGSYEQSAGSTDVDGTLISSVTSIAGGKLLGTGVIEGSVSETGGALQPGDGPGTLTVTGSVSLSNATLLEEIGGGTAAAGYSVLDVGSSLTIADSMLSLDDLNSFAPANDEVFDIINAASISGEFADNRISFAGGTFTLGYLTSGCASEAACVDLTWSATPSPAPEPDSLLLLVVGLPGLGMLVRRKPLAVR